ncbi:hypothetical protein A2303_04245 [Candidatus Falkowbacteria bacterium RIFOXYB2_FULL_47_14]|uniref:Uncharacterized protein n=1 Tax=Candidatus Falkowbacteria bacterium RIFOXYA2_FULL_47_19 TaxID=1797994 RepID=A0A1F5SK18_9BACT|nr:MAG: hypothetical protein A2227_04165 [Candidatus Falkowbacteria bacterium RIFOXYA2_FULL_47_19]OGF35382.1 MAG: hypothetical protein A2468_02335 [Candidatus Falkowbacteria bacterium RIFOXYC2_FULL_46_15]OGF43109.1 MAG: hypothetical protein A2303_04245 [Candidatus Falkowbacteria bacterium RIFOXYB2_FULL_47_14]
MTPKKKTKRPPKKIIVSPPQSEKEKNETRVPPKKIRDKTKKRGHVIKVSPLEYLEEKMQDDIRAAKAGIAKSAAAETNQGKLIISALLTGDEQTAEEILQNIEASTGKKLNLGSIAGRLSLMSRTDLGKIIRKKRKGRQYVYSINGLAALLGVGKIYQLTLVKGYSLEDAYRELPALKEAGGAIPESVEIDYEAAAKTEIAREDLLEGIFDLLDLWLERLPAEKIRAVMKKVGINRSSRRDLKNKTGLKP